MFSAHYQLGDPDRLQLYLGLDAEEAGAQRQAAEESAVEVRKERGLWNEV